MSITALDPKAALIVVDLQALVLSLPVEGLSEVVAASARLAKAFRAKDLPVVLVNVDGVAPGRTEQQRRLPELTPEMLAFAPQLEQQASDIVVTKRTWGAFTATGLEATLKGLGVTQVVVCGVATSAGVESTARQAHEAGFNVTLATDAMADMSGEAHENSILRIFPRLGETGTSEEIIAMLNATQ
jgi:nicotinamidase-related amidase